MLWCFRKKLWFSRLWQRRSKKINTISVTLATRVEDKASEIYDAYFVGPNINITKDEFVKKFDAATGVSIRRAFSEATDMMFDEQIKRGGG